MNSSTFSFEQPAGFSDPDFEALAHDLDQASGGGIRNGLLTLEADAAIVSVTFDGVDLAAATAIVEAVRDRMGLPVAVASDRPDR